MTRLTLAVVALFACAGFGSIEQSPAANAIPVLAELFTSEGCNSCPPADRLLEVLHDEQPLKGIYIVALSEHVTYWDQQGWKDPFGSAQFTNRQQQYGNRFGVESIYTPQLIVDGAHEFVGSDKAAVERGLMAAAKTPKAALHVEVASGDGALIATASGPGVSENGGELWFALTEDHLVVDVKRGENANRTLRHSGVVRILQSAGATEVTSKKATLKLSPEWKRDNLRVVAFVQSKKDRHVMSVGSGR